MIPTFRHGARALGFSGWLAALHSDKYSSLKTLDASQTGSTTGLYSTNSRIWGTDIPEEPLLGPVPFSTRSGLTEVPGMGLGNVMAPAHPINPPYVYPPSTSQIQSQIQPQAPGTGSEATNELMDFFVCEDMSRLNLDPVDQSVLDPSAGSMILEAMVSSQQQESELQQQELKDRADPRTRQPCESGDQARCPCGVRNCNHNSIALQQPIPTRVAEFIPLLDITSEQLVRCAVKDPGKYLVHLGAIGFSALADAIQVHTYSLEPIPDMTLFHLFRKVSNQGEVDRAVGILMDDRSNRLKQGINRAYDEATSATVFNALNQVGGDEFVVVAAEKCCELGLTLSRSNMYHLMKQYSVQGKVALVERLFRALETAGKSWNSNCIVIMMLAYFNQGKFEEADMLRRELRAKGFSISDRIDDRLDKLLSGEESWLWKDQVWSRPRRLPNTSMRGLSLLAQTQMPNGQNLGVSAPRAMAATRAHFMPRTDQRLFHSSTNAKNWADVEESVTQDPSPRHSDPPGLDQAILEPRQHLTQLRMSGFDELCSALDEMVNTSGPVEHVCVSFLFRKVETRREVEKAMALLEKDRQARKKLGLTQEYNETTCSRIFNALFRANAVDLALEYAASAKQSGLILSGKALHELLKTFAIQNDIDKVRDVWKLVKENGKPSSRIVYSIFRTYFDNHMMEEAAEFRKEILEMGINLSASATRNIEEVLSGSKNWVKDPKDLLQVSV